MIIKIKKKESLFALFLILIIISIFYVCYKNHNNIKKYPWYYQKMNIEKIWKYSRGNNQVIAIIDTGISNKLENSIKKKIVYKYNVLDNDNDVSDKHGHGTEMASIISGVSSENIYGISPEAKLIIIKAVSDDGKTDNEYLLKALEISEEQSATVVNISLGGFKRDELVSKKIKEMSDNNITVVAAAGDYGNKDLLFPAVERDVISVAACDNNMNVCDFSNRSEECIAMMPGDSIEAINFDENRQIVKDCYSGTSEACAITSGYIALMKGYYSSKKNVLDNADISKILKDIKRNKYTFLYPFSKND